MDTRPYWDALAEKRLVLQQCLDTGRFQHYPRPVSMFTGSRNLAWRAVAGTGVLVSWTSVSTGAPDPAQAPLQAIVQLDEGVQILARLMADSRDALTTGARVQLAWPTESSSVDGPIFVLV